MELLDLLEARVYGLVGELEKLREENKRLWSASAEHTTAVQALNEENRALQEALTQERQLKDEVLERIDALLERLKDIDTDA